MAERGLYPDGEQRRRIMDFIMAAGQTLLENGAEVFRVEQTMEIMAASFHLREFHVYVLTNGIFASAGTAEMSEVRNVPTRTTHLGRVAAVMLGSTETTFYTIAVYFGAVGISRTRYAVPAALCADHTGFLADLPDILLICRLHIVHPHGAFCRHPQSVDMFRKR